MKFPCRLCQHDYTETAFNEHMHYMTEAEKQIYLRLNICPTCDLEVKR